MKMQTLPIVPWIGGKRRLAKHILPLFPAHECYVEPFCGAAALYFLKVPGKIEVINDINGELVNLYRVVKHHLEEFVRQFKWALVSRADSQMAADHPGRNTDGYPACSTVLLPSEAGVWRQGGGAQLWYLHHIPATLQPAAY